MSVLNKIILTLTLLLLAATAFTQQKGNPEFKNFLLHRSMQQKKVGLILLTGGLVIAGIGGLVQKNADDEQVGFDFDFTGAKIAIAGGVVALAGLVTLGHSTTNKRKASRLSIGNQKIRFPKGHNLILAQQPSLTLKMGLSRRR